MYISGSLLKAGLFIFTSLCLLISSPGIKDVYATSDAGEEARLIGIMGKTQQWALIYFSDVQLEYRGAFHAVPLKKGKTELKDSFLFNFEKQENVSEQELNKLKTLLEFKGPEAEKDKKFHQYYLSHLKPDVAQKYRSNFTPAAELKIIKENNPVDDLEKDRNHKTEYTLSSGEKLILQRKILKNINAMLFFNENKNYACSHNDTPACSNCKKNKIKINGKTVTYSSCTNKTGIFIKSLPEEFYEGYKIKSQDKCECYTPGFVIAAELKSKSYSATGQEILITGHFRDSRPTIPPGLYQHTLHQTKSGHLIATGSFVHTPRLNGSYYPFVSIYAPEIGKVGE